MSHIPPTIVVDTPTKASKHSKPLTPIDTNTNTNTAINTSTNTKNPAPSQTSCYLCDEQNPGDFSPTTKFLETCLLCARPFCPIHKSASWAGVCNINHSTHYHACLQAAAAELARQGRGEVVHNKRAMAEILIAKGIYPSLGEREKAIFSTSPVSDAKIREIESYRSLDARLSGTKDLEVKDDLIEEKDLVGADIAV